MPDGANNLYLSSELIYFKLCSVFHFLHRIWHVIRKKSSTFRQELCKTSLLVFYLKTHSWLPKISLSVCPLCFLLNWIGWKSLHKTNSNVRSQVSTNVGLAGNEQWNMARIANAGLCKGVIVITRVAVLNCQTFSDSDSSLNSEQCWNIEGREVSRFEWRLQERRPLDPPFIWQMMTIPGRDSVPFLHRVANACQLQNWGRSSVWRVWITIQLRLNKDCSPTKLQGNIAVL